MPIYTYFRQNIRTIKSRIYSLHMKLLNHQLFVKEQPSQSYNICSVVTRINTEGESFIMNYSLGKINKAFLERVQCNRPCNWDVQIMRTVHTRFEFNDFWITYHTVQRSTRVVDLGFSNPSFKRHVNAIMQYSIIMNYKLEINVINALLHHITVQ